MILKGSDNPRLSYLRLLTEGLATPHGFRSVYVCFVHVLNLASGTPLPHAYLTAVLCFRCVYVLFFSLLTYYACSPHCIYKDWFYI